MLLKEIKLDRVFVIDIETVPQQECFDKLSKAMQDLWEQKSRYQRSEGQTAAAFYEKAGIWAEFGKIICISIGAFYLENKQVNLRICSFYNHDEKIVLKQFQNLLQQQADDLILCAHNGKEFDFPYLCRRLLINGIPIPNQLQISGKKPWEVHHIDTMEFWKFGDYKSYTSLNLLAAVFNLPSPKENMDGSMVKDLYYHKKDLKRIAQYCQSDVITTAQILLKFKLLPIITSDRITILP